MEHINSITVNEILEFHTYQQLKGTIIKIIRGGGFYARAVNNFIQEYQSEYFGDLSKDEARKLVAKAIAYEEKLGSKLL